MGKKRKAESKAPSSSSPKAVKTTTAKTTSATTTTTLLSKILQKKQLVLSTIDPDAQQQLNMARKDKVEGVPSEPEPVSTQEVTYRDLTTLVQSHNGVVTQLLSKKTFALVTTSSARAAGTQKVRKAYKKGVPIVDVQWVRDCISSSTLLPLTSFRREDDVKDVVEKKNAEKQRRMEKEAGVSDVSFVPDGDPSENPDADYWSAPVSFGCSCVCHENNPDIVTDCPWCVDCNIDTHLRKLACSAPVCSSKA
mmetsp:Transcript_23789/g.49572  ORF Transcript_23789/g.49572 Transcript_23789/m.49572 type:complete len:251 (-) Transcript_23789:21-773(-)